LNEVNVLAQDVGWRAHLEIIDEVIVRHEVRVPILDDVSTVPAEEERFRRTNLRVRRSIVFKFEIKRLLHILPQTEHALLWVVPLLLVEEDIELERSGLITSLGADGISVVIHGGIGERRSGSRTIRQSIQDKTERSCCGAIAWRAVGQVRLVTSLAEVRDRCLLDVCAGFG